MNTAHNKVAFVTGASRGIVGAPPSVPAAVVSWLACMSSAEAAERNGSTLNAQKIALERGLHADWRAG